MNGVVCQMAEEFLFVKSTAMVLSRERGVKVKWVHDCVDDQ